MTRRARLESLAAVAFALAAAAVPWVAAWSARGSEDPAVVRLLERALAPDGAFRFEAEDSSRPSVQTISRWRFRGGRAGWVLLDEQGRPVRIEDPALGADAARGVDDGAGEAVLRFPTGRGGIAGILPAAPQRLLRIAARDRRAPSRAAAGGGATPFEAAVIVQPLQAVIDLESELATRSYAEVIGDPRIHVGHGSIRSSPSVPEGDSFEWTSVTIVTPGPTRALLVQFGAGNGSGGAPIDLAEIELQEVALRGVLGLGAEPVEPGVAPPASLDPRELALLPPPDPARPALRKVEDLLERRDALVLPPPSRASFEVDLPSGALRFEYGLTRVHEARRGFGAQPIEVALRIEPAEGGADAIERAETLGPGGPSGWQERSLEVSALAGRRVRMTFETEGATSDLVAVGAPLVRRVAPRDPRPNVIVVSIDTLRADRLSAAGYPRPTTPNLDALARESAWFRDASSTSSYTLPAHASLLTGQLPSRHGAESERAGRNRIFADRSDLLAVRMREAGWLTAAFTGGVYLRPAFGFDQGFDRYDSTDLFLTADNARSANLPVPGEPEWNAGHRRSRRIDHALDWIRARADGRFLLFVHTYLVHDYLADPAHDARFHGSCASALAPTDVGWIRDRTRTGRPPAADLAHFEDRYDASLHQADAEIGRLLGLLRELGLMERTILVVTSDHGEEFGDHGGVNHGRTLFEEVVRVPLIVRAPGFAPSEIVAPVSLVDVAPTLLELLGLEPRAALDGRSLVPLLRGEPMEARALEAELNLVKFDRWAMRRDGSRKAIEARDERSESEIAEHPEPGARRPTRGWVFDPGVDPRETRDRAEGDGQEQVDAAELLADLETQREEMRERRAQARRDAGGEHAAADAFDVRTMGGYVEPAPEDDD